tara:strand:+ start:167 stop:412 length:246 start_codon:yes stop_codon:yes gene_type:complete
MSKYIESLSWVKEAYLDGINAFKIGPSKRECPHEGDNNMLREYWLKGYEEAETNHEEQVTCLLLFGEAPVEVNNFIVKHGL